MLCSWIFNAHFKTDEPITPKQVIDYVEHLKHPEEQPRHDPKAAAETLRAWGRGLLGKR